MILISLLTMYLLSPPTLQVSQGCRSRWDPGPPPNPIDQDPAWVCKGFLFRAQGLWVPLKGCIRSTIRGILGVKYRGLNNFNRVWGPLCYNQNKEPQNSIGNYLGPYIRV